MSGAEVQGVTMNGPTAITNGVSITHKKSSKQVTEMTTTTARTGVPGDPEPIRMNGVPKQKDTVHVDPEEDKSVMMDIDKLLESLLIPEEPTNDVNHNVSSPNSSGYGSGTWGKLPPGLNILPGGGGPSSQLSPLSSTSSASPTTPFFPTSPMSPQSPFCSLPRSPSTPDGAEVVHHTPRFVRDTSKYWYKPNISRDEAIAMLKDKPPGTFVVRDSNSFAGAFGLAVKVAQVPPNVQTKGGDPLAELVRHFLIEPTPKGVKLKGCSNEPVFGSLAALVYQHSITPLALPCKLHLPDMASYSPAAPSEDVVDAKGDVPNSASQLLQQGAACNVLYINSVDTESLTGPQAVSKSIKDTFTGAEPKNKTTVVHFKVSSQGITLTDNKRKLFFRRHYPVNTVTYCGMDPEERRLPEQEHMRLFGFVARKPGSATDNACHLFAELDPDQPATAIVNFVTKVMIGQGRIMKS